MNFMVCRVCLTHELIDILHAELMWFAEFFRGRKAFPNLCADLNGTVRRHEIFAKIGENFESSWRNTCHHLEVAYE